MDSRGRFLSLIVGLFCLVAFLTHQVAVGGMLVDLDRAVIRLARDVAPSRDLLLIVDKLALRGLILFVCIPFLVWLSRRERTWVSLGGFVLVLLFQTGMTGSLKMAVGRTFPYQREMLLGTDSLAFPSGHATNAAALWGFVLWWLTDARREYRRAAVVAFGSILVIAGTTSVFLRTHWPTDLVAGYAIGGIALSTVVAMLCAMGLNPAARAGAAESGDRVAVGGAVSRGATSPRPRGARPGTSGRR